jgi:SM-20-related protein
MDTRMRARLSEFNPQSFSFHTDPVLILNEFWSPEERARFRAAMGHQKWTSLSDLPETSHAFPNCGNWAKAQIQAAEASLLMNRLALPCVIDYMESFPQIKGRHVSFNYYSYAMGDCLSLHDDTDQGYGPAPGVLPPTRRLAVVGYYHERWEPNWGGELLVYETSPGPAGTKRLGVTHCIIPEPGSLVIFSVPRVHRVARVDPLAGINRRLSTAGWLMTEH